MFCIACLAKGKTLQNISAVVVVTVNKEEAIGKAYLKYIEMYKAEDGWHDHRFVATEADEDMLREAGYVKATE